ncbi:MAG: toxin-antitoxin system YwqK family antitoxin [Candidatus Marinimicrobia bacterium]|nr:toxin-antitoxin system YwqK family antitoxin [Candidatus Neomarinimicrobiota bacterium]
MKIEMEIKESYKRFSALQKIISLFFIFTIIFAIIHFIVSFDAKFFMTILLISTAITLFIFSLTKNNNPFVMTKTSVEQFNLMGEANFFTVKKTYVADSPWKSKFRIRNLLMIKEYRQDGSLFTVTPYKNGKIWGEVKTYAIDGKLRNSAFYCEGEIDGKKIEMSGNDITNEKNYKGAHLHGVSKTFDKDTGNLVAEEHFSYGLRHGESKYYDGKTGNIQHTEHYKSGYKSGIFRYYDEEGNLRKEEQYLNDVLHGRTLVFFSNGKIQLEEEYINGKLEGSSKEYYEDGTLRNEYRYREGEKHGPQLAFYKSGVIMSKIFYNMGKKSSEAIHFDPDGNPVE